MVSGTELKYIEVKKRHMIVNCGVKSWKRQRYMMMKETTQTNISKHQ